MYGKSSFEGSKYSKTIFTGGNPTQNRKIEHLARLSRNKLERRKYENNTDKKN